MRYFCDGKDVRAEVQVVSIVIDQLERQHNPETIAKYFQTQTRGFRGRNSKACAGEPAQKERASRGILCRELKPRPARIVRWRAVAGDRRSPGRGGETGKLFANSDHLSVRAYICHECVKILNPVDESEKPIFRSEAAAS